MQHTKSAQIMLALILTCAASPRSLMGREYEKGDVVIAVNDTELKVKNNTVGSVPKGEKLTIEDIS